MLRTTAAIAAGKLARTASRLRGGGSGGSALPGLVAERIDPAFLRSTLGGLPRGIVVVSGTNGKTTTTKMVVALLRAHGLRGGRVRARVGVRAWVGHHDLHA